MQHMQLGERKRSRVLSFFSPSFFQFITVGVTLLFFILPISKLVYLSFTDESGMSFGTYMDILQEPDTWSVLNNTFIVVLGSTVLSCVLGIAVAWLVAYTNVRYKAAMQVFIMLPFVIPSYITTLAWTQFMSKNGFLASVLSILPGSPEPPDVYSYTGIIVVMGLSHYPLVYLLTVGVLRKIPRELEYAARASGAGYVRSFWSVTLPLALPGIASGGFLAFLANLDNFGIPAFLGIPANISVLSTYIYEQIVGFGPSAFARGAALSVLLGIVAVCGASVQWLLLRRSKRVEGYEDKEPRLYVKSKARFVMELTVWSFLIITSIVPLVSMVSTSLIKAYGLPFTIENLSLKHYDFILFQSTKAQSALTNSLLLAFVSTLICIIVGTAFAYIRTRRGTTLWKSMEAVIGLSYALPGTVLALAMILTWMEPIPGWNPGIYGSIYILLIAYFTRFLILQIRGSSSALLQVDPAVEEAAHASGANGYYKWKNILLPLIWPGVISGAFLVFLTALTELTLSSLLWSSGLETIGVVIFNFEQAGYTTNSTAFSTVVIFFIIIGYVALYGVQKLWNRKVLRNGNNT